MLHLVELIEKRFPDKSGVIVKVAITVLGLGLIVGAALLMNTFGA